MLLEVSSKSPLRHLDLLPTHEEPQLACEIFAQSWHSKSELAENPIVISGHQQVKKKNPPSCIPKGKDKLDPFPKLAMAGGL